MKQISIYSFYWDTRSSYDETVCKGHYWIDYLRIFVAIQEKLHIMDATKWINATIEFFCRIENLRCVIKFWSDSYYDRRRCAFFLSASFITYPDMVENNALPQQGKNRKWFAFCLLNRPRWWSLTLCSPYLTVMI